MTKTWFTRSTMTISRSSTSLAPAVRRLKIDKRRLCMTVAALVVAVSSAACRSSSPNDPPLPSGIQPTDHYIPTTDPYVPPREEPTYQSPSSDETSPQTTDPCAFSGDPLCPDTPVTVPPPDVGNW
jgi:hypothetical protein